MVKRLTLDDMKTVEQHRAEMEKLTEEEVQRLGHPSKKVMRLEWRLSEIAGKWRSNQDDMGLVHEYKSVLYELILNGYNVDGLPIHPENETEQQRGDTAVEHQSMNPPSIPVPASSRDPSLQSPPHRQMTMW